MRWAPDTAHVMNGLVLPVRSPTVLPHGYRRLTIVEWWRQRWCGMRPAVVRALVVSFGLAAGLFVGSYVGLVLPKGGPRWAVGAGTVAWATFSSVLLLVHSLSWHWSRRGSRSDPGTWTRAVGSSSVPGTLGSIGLSGAAALAAVTVEVGQPVHSTATALLVAASTVALAVLTWYGGIALRLRRARGFQSPRQSTRPASPAAEWIAGLDASRRAESTRSR